MNANMKVSEQCRIAASKGDPVLGMIRRNITYKDKSLIVSLYKAIVRPRFCHNDYKTIEKGSMSEMIGKLILEPLNIRCTNR